MDFILDKTYQLRDVEPCPEDGTTLISPIFKTRDGYDLRPMIDECVEITFARNSRSGSWVYGIVCLTDDEGHGSALTFDTLDELLNAFELTEQETKNILKQAL